VAASPVQVHREVDGAQKRFFDGGKELAGSNGLGDIAIHAGGETLFLIPFKVCAVIATIGVRMPKQQP
jgi:hypothetical protein